MGTWGHGGFDNDAAMDFAATVESVDSLAAVFDCAPGDDIDGGQAQEIIAAAECVAAMLGHPPGYIPADLAARLAAFGPPSDALLEAARAHVTMVTTESELLELWADGDKPEKFHLEMKGLAARLASAG